MANARPDRPTSFEGGATEGEEDDDNNVDKHSHKDEPLTSNNKQNGVPPVRNVDRYGFMGGDQYTSPEEIPKVTLDIIRKREVKWMEMFENWEKWMTKRFKRVRARCRKGIPPSLRARAWQYLCGSKFLMDQNQGKFEEYLHKAGDPKWIEDIHKDLHRQFPLHEIFALRGGHGQEDLFRILKAYTIHNPQDGYCQAQGPIAAVLLMHMPAEQAFWCLVSICEKYLPGYYSPGLEAVHIDGDVLFGLLKKSSPLIYKHLKKQKIEPILYMTEWFMCIFSRTLPWTAVLRVWDMFFCEGVKVMFRIALVLFKLTLGTPEKLSECPTLYETMEKLRHIPHELIDGEFISKESLKLNVDEKDMEKEHQYQITKRRNQREKAQSSAKADKKSAKQKKKEKQLENEQENKKQNSNSHLTFWKTQNKLWTHKDNIFKTTVPKPTEDEQILQPPSSVSETETETPKKLQPSMIAKMQKMEMAKILAEEAFTAKVQQTQQPDAQLSAEVEQSVSLTTIESSSKDTIQQTSQSVQLMTQTSSSDLSSFLSESVSSSETKIQCISLDQPATIEKPLLGRSSLSTEEKQPEESKRYSSDGNQLQHHPVQVSEEVEVKSPLHFADTRTATVVQKTHSYHKTEDNAEMHQVNLAAKLEPGQLMTYPTSQVQTRSESPNSSQLLIQEAENEQHFFSDNQFTYSGFTTSERASPAEMQRLDTYKSRSENSSPSRDVTCKYIQDPVCLDKIQHLGNLTATDPVESPQVSDASAGVSSSGEVAELESLFVNPLLIESNKMGWQPVEQLVVDNISSDINDAEHQQTEHFEDQTPPNIDQVSATISSILQHVSPVTLEDVSDETQPQHQQSSVDEQSVPTKQTDLTNTHIVMEPNNSTADNEIETSELVHQNQTLTVEPLIVKSQQVRPKHSLAASQQTQSSQPLSTEIVKDKPLKLSSTLEIEVNSFISESKNSPSKTRSVSPVKQLVVESLLVKTQRPVQSAIESSSKERSPVMNLVSPQENPRSEENQTDSIENQCSTLGEDPNTVTDNLVGESESKTIQESDDIDQTNVTEQFVQHLSWQTVQNSNKDDTTIPPVETEANLSPKYDSTQMKESHV